ncbi:polysaccharide pyruvyl transferase family protein [Methylopila henanensis]|uniref:Polysaccharide pyruvyl transferase family protein n=1 Tax=Methylopila henanensis TaxID=873516 RepID=A0ABW4K3L0_9HYPH
MSKRTPAERAQRLIRPLTDLLTRRRVAAPSRTSAERPGLRAAAFGFSTYNIGDDIQSYAALARLPRLDALIARDRMAIEALDGPHLAIFNSWFKQGQDYRTPHPSIEPALFGFALGADKLLTSAWKPWLAARDPIGARDLDSAELLRATGLAADWVGCLTLFIGRGLPPVPEDQRRGVLIVDLPDEAIAAHVPARLREGAEVISNFLPPLTQGDPLMRYAALARLLERLRTARLVITRRLHVALPCVGFGTPVVALPDRGISNALRRFSGFRDFVPTAFLDDPASLAAIDWDEVRPAVIPEPLVRAADRLESDLAARFGMAAPQLKAPLYDGRPLTLRNPGLGPEPMTVTLSMRGVRRACRADWWSTEAIELELPWFSGVERMMLDVSVTPRRSGAVRRIGALPDLLLR